jgi:hypothetical protein
MVIRLRILNWLAAGGAAGLLGGAQRVSAAQTGVGHYRVWNAHTGLHSVPGNTREAGMEVLIRCADRLGIERSSCHKATRRLATHSGYSGRNITVG